MISTIRAGDIPLVYEAILSASWGSMLICKIWTERISVVEAHLPEFTCQFTLIIITSQYMYIYIYIIYVYIYIIIYNYIYNMHAYTYIIYSSFYYWCCCEWYIYDS